MTSTPTVARDVLTQLEAEERAARVSNCRYEIALDIQANAETYHGDVTITFDLAGEGSIFLNHRGKTIHELTVNGAAVEPDWSAYRLTLPAASLAPHNTVRIRYENEYDHTGDGFHQFIDPEDGEEYIYSQFEPFESHRLFPNFDQPDIKATYRLAVTAPANWQVVSNAPEEQSEPVSGGRTRHVFAGTPRFSTYLFALVVGPYDVYRAEHSGIPLGLYCRKSLSPFIDTDELFEITRQGLDFFGAFFDYPYPFKKYDQLFVPENNSGAMENIGCVTFNEAFIYRDPPTDNQRRRRAEVILHEMAHMWFGDLVTMRWWNDLWLNESFATFMAYLAMTKATRFTSGWQDFNASIKNWAYRQDQLVTTHPISGPVGDTDETFLNFDGITYGKGASVLKQLFFAIGEEGFREGMRQYFRVHQYENATLAQFLESLEAGSGQSLGEWSRLWLETPSLNTIGVTWEADGERITRLALTQTAPDGYPTIRPHAFEVGLIRETDGRLDIESLPARVDGPEAELAAAVGRPKPDLVFPNYGDYAYAKIALDAESAAWVRANIDRVGDVLLRQLLWSSVWNMVRDQQLSSLAYLEMVRDKGLLEPETGLLDPILAQATTALARFVPEELKDEECHRLFETAWQGLRAATTEDGRIIWGRTLVAAAVTPGDVRRAARLADGAESVPGFTVDQQMRWDIAAKFVAYDLDGAAERVATEVANDPSDRGQRAKLRCDTSVPDFATKLAAWERIAGDGYGTLKLTTAAMSGFNWSKQRELLAPFVDRFFDEVAGIFQAKENQFFSDYFASLYPAYRVERDTLERSQRLLADAGDADPTLARMLREAIDELDRAIRCREFAAKG
ncbi:MAG: aminopeptidase N [Dehalococcoidia bacterium]|nr:aminopeptidase N [Dehalococcoidia bacterium]